MKHIFPLKYLYWRGNIRLIQKKTNNGFELRYYIVYFPTNSVQKSTKAFRNNYEYINTNVIY